MAEMGRGLCGCFVDLTNFAGGKYSDKEIAAGQVYITVPILKPVRPLKQGEFQGFADLKYGTDRYTVYTIICVPLVQLMVQILYLCGP